ncbi:MAG: hypothetical protein VB858_19180 [Planctomycetaceae bacterium]
MSPRNHADCVGNYSDAVLSGEIIAGRTFRSLLAQFGLTPKSKRGLAARDPVRMRGDIACILRWDKNQSLPL